MAETPSFDVLSNFNNNQEQQQQGTTTNNNNNTMQHTDDLLNEFLDSRIYDHTRNGNIKDEQLDHDFDLEVPGNNNNNNNNEDIYSNTNQDLIHSLLSQNFIENASNSHDDDYIFKINSSNESNNSIIPPQTPPNDQIDTASYQMLEQNVQDMDIDYGFSGYYDTSKLTDTQSEEFQLYEESRKELMKLKFGGPTTTSNNGMLGTTIPIKSEDNSVDLENYQIPEAYFDTSNDDNLPYKLQITGLPDHSRVETQIKISLSVSPAPPQFLLQLPADTISKTKLRLQEDVPESSKKHILYLDTYVLTSGDSSSSSPSSGKKKKSTTNSETSSPNDSTNGNINDIKLNESMKSCNICSRCVRRELKRASRRKNGTLEDGFNWNLMGPKRAVIFNCKEIISFPPPTVASALTNSTNRDDIDEYINTDDSKSTSDEKKIELSSRIICYCRHHSESKGFRLFFVLKNHEGEILGKTFSRPIMIMDRKKSTTSEKSQGASDVKKEHPLSPTSLDESSSEAQTAVSDYARPSKRKRAWSPSAGSTSTYYDSVSQQRTLSTVGSIGATRKDILSPTDSEHQRSPNVFHNTPERTASITSITSNSSSYVASKNVLNTHTPMPLPLMAPPAPTNQPSIQRIIPAQGPIRGGIEVTLLGSNFRPGLIVKFGANQALTTHCWSDSTIVTYLPPASNPGQVLVTFENLNNNQNSEHIPPQQVFTYTDDTDRQLIELALQIVGLKMNGKLEDAKNIAKRIIGNSNDPSTSNSPVSGPSQGGMTTNSASKDSIDDDWFLKATETVKQLSQSSLDSEEVLLRFLSLIDLPNAPIMTPNWAVCTIEGQTLLHLAAIRNHYKLVLYLIKRGSRIDYKDVNDYTPLHLAFLNGNREIIEVLIRCGASMNHKIRNNVTLEKISNSNVLDLIPSGDEYVESNIDDIKSHTRRSSTDSISSMFNDIDSSLRQHVSRIVDDCFSPSSDLPQGEEEALSGEYDDEFADESESYDEQDDDELESVTEKEEESGTDQESLPNYDDLFPSSNSLKSLIKSVTGGSKTTAATAEQGSTSAVSEEDEGIEEIATVEEPSDDKILRFFINNSTRTTPIMRDLMLFFFWLPLLIITVVLVLGSSEHLVFQDQFDKVNDFLRLRLLNLMLGRERVQGLLY